MGRDLKALSQQNPSDVLKELKASFDSGITRPYLWRKKQLLMIERFLEERENDIYEALQQDFRKSRAETFFTEIHYLQTEIRHALRHLRSWMKPRRVHTPLRYQPGRSYYYSEPCGVVLVIGAWNYPLQLALAPAIGAIAAGNCVVIKPSERAPATSALLVEAFGDYIDRRALRLFPGGADEGKEMVKEPFDHIFFTGGKEAGKKVMAAAAAHLTPVTLELGGKNPCVVDRSVDIDVAARRIVWAKFLNAGQTCIAPDYVLVHRDLEKELLKSMKDALEVFYGAEPEKSSDYPALISAEQLRRLTGYMKDGTVVTGGVADSGSRYCSPTILCDIAPGSPVLTEEIFGPLLPVVTYTDTDNALETIRKAGQPLAVYLFSNDRSFQRTFVERTRSGGLCINDLMFQAAVPALPFGGTGECGNGRYHGKSGFDTFSRQRSVHVKGLFPENRLRYPPFEDRKFRILRMLFRFFK